jgi:chromosome segregation ATPase
MAKLAICFVALLALAVEAEKVSPVQKVIQLLDDLKGKVQGDLDNEGKAMAEYSSWCDQQIGDTDYAIKTASRQIEGSNAQIEESENTITAKTGEIADLGTAISTKEKELVDAEGVYKGEKADTDSSESELINSIDELSGAIVQLKKGAALVQVQKRLQPFADVLGRIVDATGVNFARKRQLSAFLQTEDTEDADLTLNAPQGSVDIGGGGHSGGIMQTLEDMKAKAEGQLSDVRKAAMESKHNYDMTKMSVTQEVNNLNSQLGSATATKAATAEALGKAKGELAETQKSKAASEELLATTKMDCEAKASEWAERQKEAGEEMAAIAKAKEILANGVKAFLQVSVKSRVVDEEDMEDQVRDRLVTVIQNLSNKYHSFALMQLTNRAKQDPFGKLKSMIGEMIEKLLKEANAEAEQKAFCDTEISKSRKSQEEKTLRLDKVTARMDTAATTIAELQEAVKTLEAEVAEIDSTTAEASAIRNEEHAEFLKASKDYKDSSEAVAAAVQVLKSYYEGSFIQVKSRTRRASQPEFGGKSDTGGTIISVLEIAESDFTKLLAEAETAEEAAAKAFATLSQESQVSKAAKQAEVKGKQSEMSTLQANLENYKEDKASTGSELDAVMAYLDKLKPQCESKAMSYEEKVARREAEIEGLKEALAILEGQDIPALIQQKAFLSRVKRA